MGGQMIYTFVARGNTVLVEHTDFSGNFSAIAVQCLEKMPKDNNRFTFPHGSHTLNYLILDGYVYMVLCDQDVDRALSFGFLERVKDEFIKKYSAVMKSAVTENSKLSKDKGLQKEFSSKLKEHLEYVKEHPEELSKFAKIKSQVNEVKSVMTDNIRQVLERGEKLELLQEKSHALKDQTTKFKKQTVDIQKNEWYKNVRVKFMMFGIVAIIILVLIVVIFS